MATVNEDEWVDEKPSDDEWIDEKPESPSIPDYGTLGNIGAGLFKGPSIGEYIPIVGSGAAALGNKVGAGIESLFSDDSMEAIEARNAQRDKISKDQYAKDYPAAHNFKSIAGAMMFPFGKAADAALPAAGYMASLGRGAINVGEGALVAGADQLAQGNYSEAGPAAYEALKTGAIGQGAFAGMEGLARAYASFVAGIRPETLTKYVGRRETINELDEEPFVREAQESLSSVKNKAADIRNTALSESKRAQSANRDNARTENLNYRDESKRALDANDKAFQDSLLSEKAYASNARSLAEEEALRAKEANQSLASRLEREAAESLSDTMKTSGRKIGQASSEAMRTLDDYEGEIPLKWYKGQLTKGINANKFGEALLPNEGVDVLLKYKGLLDGAGVDAVPARDLKRLVQSLDADLASAFNNASTGGYNNPATKSLMTMRRLVSARLKRDVPGYSDAMQPVAEMTGTLRGLQKEIPNPDPDRIMSKLSGIDDPRKQSLRQKVQRVEEKFGGNSLAKISEAQRLKGIDPTGGNSFEVPNQQVIDFLKGLRDQRAQEITEKLRNSQSKVESSRLLKELAIIEKQGRDVKPANVIDQAIGGMGEASIQGRLRSFGNNPEKNISLRDKLENLASMSGKEKDYFTQGADDLAVKRAMEGTFVRGSRNVNMMKYSAEGLMNALGMSEQGAKAFGGIGALLGSASDIIGPKAVKFVIDQGESKLGKTVRNVLSRAAKAGPQALAQEHARLLRENEEYRRTVED